MLHCEYNVSLTHPCVEHEKLVRPKRISNTLFFTHHETSETSLCNSDTLNSFVFFNHFSINSDAIIISSKSRSICSNQTVFTATWIRNDSIGWHRVTKRSRPTTIYNDNMYKCSSAGGSTWLCRALSSACGAAARPASASGGGLCRWRAPDISATEEQTGEITYRSRRKAVFFYDSQLYTVPMTPSHLRVIVTQTITQMSILLYKFFCVTWAVMNRFFPSLLRFNGHTCH